MKEALKSTIATIDRFGRLLGEITSWLVLGVLISVLIAVIAGALGANEMLSWGVDLPILGTKLTINGIFDLEWHFFAIMVMTGGTYAYLDDKHVRSDLIYANLPSNIKTWIDTIGDVFLLIPFAAVMVWLSSSFVARSFNSSEASDYGGLVDRFLIKATIPIGFSILIIIVLARVIKRFIDVYEEQAKPSKVRLSDFPEEQAKPNKANC
ncbi:TRAP transporter small permease subunit [Marinobacterium rhizophilum]|uniref:TRAP transporter small permease protein n=1 Tax=Marinobacterium rhizophilum TaxID=420402 RepID=A0ABY5HJ42_9GAMM|nr:TRAP transporter small permease subunit [Marinobacterium rhizophilum]UTW11969.1 TRAP transporter small permease subunit [Marinobacterium rhizophilum]